MISLADLSWTVLLIDLGFALGMLALGVLAGWLLSPRSGNVRLSDKATDAIEKLRELASTVAADVGQHTSRMHAINTGLSAANADGSASHSHVSQTVGDIVRANEQLQQQLLTAEIRLERQEAELKSHLEAARTDALTGIANRRAFDDELTRRIAEWTRRKSIFSLAMIDVDYFKKLNDKYGHQTGDAVLKGVAQTLRGTLREMDFLARYGGEEFAAVLPVTNQQEALRTAERIRSAIEQAVYEHDGHALRVQCSFGVAQVLPGSTAADLVKRADEALYESKSGGRNCIYCHTGEACLPASELLEQPLAEREETTDIDEHTPGQAGGGVALEQASGFHADLCRRVEESHKFRVPLTLLMIEIDNFDLLSEEHGVTIADVMYDTLGDFLRMVMQEMDVASRRGNGQYAILMPGTDLESAIAVAERLRTAVEGRALQVADGTLRMTLSAGVSEISEREDASMLVRRAAAALFAARHRGCNCTYAHTGQGCEPVENSVVSA